MRQNNIKNDAQTASLAVPGEKNRFLGDRDAAVARIRKLVQPVCDSEGMEMVHLEFQRESQGRVLRLYLDQPGGVTIDDCARISRQVSDLMDVYIDEPDAYTLEVSSAGLNRPLGKQSDFERFAGHKAAVKTKEPVSGRKQFKGILRGLTDGKVEIEVDDKVFYIDYDVIKKAQLVNDDGVNQ